MKKKATKKPKPTKQVIIKTSASFEELITMMASTPNKNKGKK
jgi:hypothetical protein